MFKSYLQQIFSKAKTDEASERTYYPVLEELLKKYREGSEIIIEARRSSVGIPDFKIETEKGLLVGYIEAKDLGRDLDKLSKGEQDQLEKYKKEYPKLIVTNFIEFRLFENCGLVDSVIITQPVTLKIGIPVLDNEGRVRGLFERFFSTTIPSIYTSKRLSELLAHKTRVLRGLILEEIDLTDDEETETEKLLKTFQTSLKPDMTPEIFSDMYAQTITFGLFVARINSDHQVFNRFTAHKLIPHTIPLLKKVFWILSGQDVPQHIEWQVDEVAEILANTNIEKISEEFFSHGKGRDPIVHFYETFLEEYDSRQREQLGVYYTPPPVVSFITRSLNIILKKHFGKNEGFADTSVITLDPAAGTLTFPAEAIAIAKHEFETAHGTGGWHSLVKNHILKNFYAFEILMAPYAVGHLKISLLLKELGYEMGQDERFNLYLTNTLDMSKFHLQQAVLAEEISKESEEAYEIKNSVPVLVVMGNPPYSGNSSNKGKQFEWIENQIETYKKINGESLGEKNPKMINDDYVKFMRFAQWKIDRAGQGALGFITNHGWLDNPTFRGMRNSFMQSFSEIYILNLHGNTFKKERVPGDIQKKERIDERDEGVFGIRPGTSITIAIKKKDNGDTCKVYYSEQWGLRQKKFEWLDNHSIGNTDWVSLKPSSPSFFFYSRNEEGWEAYKQYPSIVEIFPINSVGVVTSRDGFVTDFNKSTLENRIRNFINSTDSDDIIKQAYNLKENKSWTVKCARDTLRKVDDWQNYIVKEEYRPFDKRWLFYHPAVIERDRREVMRHFSIRNIGLICNRTIKSSDLSHFWVTDLLNDYHILETANANAYTFPLFLQKNNTATLFDNDEENINLNWNALPSKIKTIESFRSNTSENLINKYEAIYFYIYSILYSNIYREKYQEFLKSDFPRIPFTKDYELFQRMATLGEQLVELHLLKSKLLDSPRSRYEGCGDDRVERRNYDIKSRKVFINELQHFDKVEPEVWNYFIGGYKVLDQWLKYRMDRILSLEDQLHFRKIITALSQTVEIQKRIDKFYPSIEKSLAKI